MNAADKGQVVKSAAHVYEEFFVPALFGAWGMKVVEAADIQSGHQVLDVACGTGVAARAAAERIGADGQVIGIDINEDMLERAKAASVDICYQRAAAEQLPFEDSSFDAVVSQFGLMFFEDKVKAIQEMSRTLCPNGRMAIAVWDSLENTPGYAAMTRLLERLFGKEMAKALEAPFILGDKAVLAKLFEDAGLEEVEIKTLQGRARFPSIASWVHTDIKGWTLADMINEDQYQTLLLEAEQELSGFVARAGNVVFDAPAHIVTWQKQA